MDTVHHYFVNSMMIERNLLNILKMCRFSYDTHSSFKYFEKITITR